MSTLFAAFLGNNPIAAPARRHRRADRAVRAPTCATLTGNRFFPQLISGPFHHGLVVVFTAAAVMAAVAALASLLRGTRHIHDCSQSPEGKSLCPTP